jgi:proteasome lid subunit RPN8/RPN11
MNKVCIPKPIKKFMRSYGKGSPTYEVCGALLGHKNDSCWDITKFVPLKNSVGNSGQTHYIPEPNEFFNVIKTTTHFNNNNNIDFLGIFHTHPNNLPNPSPLDISGAGYEGVYIIFSPKDDCWGFYYYDGNEEEKKWIPIDWEIKDGENISSRSRRDRELAS